MPDKTKFTHPSKPGEDQSTTFIHTKMEDVMSECPKTKMTNESVSRGREQLRQVPLGSLSEHRLAQRPRLSCRGRSHEQSHLATGRGCCAPSKLPARSQLSLSPKSRGCCS